MATSPQQQEEVTDQAFRKLMRQVMTHEQGDDFECGSPAGGSDGARTVHEQTMIHPKDQMVCIGVGDPEGFGEVMFSRFVNRLQQAEEHRRKKHEGTTAAASVASFQDSCFCQFFVSESVARLYQTEAFFRSRECGGAHKALLGPVLLRADEDLVLDYPGITIVTFLTGPVIAVVDTPIQDAEDTKRKLCRLASLNQPFYVNGTNFKRVLEPVFGKH